ncbi:MAG TPA: ABC transporter ATP-binding protein [Candidatus Butyricicoccus avistercoris]|uniref:ABC transporter ATP-binding protein n=1 Tax=Candidatus Butyricicoccus avistercoris TaxID=2838518 RepID=A0A9D1THM4_9FIRM|nr:ABC transporter ATP-binding protein [Candidatus Butyricicoccus avistercoris]
MDKEIQISVDNVSMEYIIDRNGIKSIKEYVVSFIKGNLKVDKFQSLNDVSFSVNKGEVFGVIGKNGAGKSTLLKVISGILKPSNGSVKVHGTIAPLLELGSGFDSDLTGYENIFLNGSILGYSKQFLEENYQKIVDFSGLGDFIYSPIRTYSSGMMMRLAFSIAAVIVPDVLIVDEILAVGDAAFQKKSKQRMKELMSGGTTVLFVSHDLEQIRTMCDRVVWLENGKVRALGEADEICSQYKKESEN